MKRFISLIMILFVYVNVFAAPIVIPVPPHIHYGDLTLLDQYKRGDIQTALMSELSGYVDVTTNTVIRDNGSEAVVYFQAYEVWYMYEGCKHNVCLKSRIKIMDTPVPADEAKSYLMHKKDNMIKHYDDESDSFVYNKSFFIRLAMIFILIVALLLMLIISGKGQQLPKVTVEHGPLDIKYNSITKEIEDERY